MSRPSAFRLKQIEEAETAVAWLRAHANNGSVIAARILVREQAALAELKRGLKP
jgi:hypothetical protein